MMNEELKVSYMTEKVFDLNIIKPFKHLLTTAQERFLSRAWVAQVTFWDDGDYKITLQSSFADALDKFSYQKSIGRTIYQKTSVPLVNLGEEATILEEKTLNEE